MRHIKTAVLGLAALLFAGIITQPARAEVSFELAYSNLSGHGSWLVSAEYGHVWQPSVYDRQWNPYYDGHWVYTDMGWAWVSDYAWGAIPYHYGTWVADPRFGWVWIPGRTWAPSWVVFRTGPDYIGWAPVPPGFSVGVSFDFGGSSNFVFVSSRDFLAPRLRNSIVPRDRVNVFINNTTIVNNITIENNVVINRGPDYRTVERATGRKLREERIESVARVAPFDRVSRSQLTVDPERSKRGLRVAEPVPASRALPGKDKATAKQRPDARTTADTPKARREPAPPREAAAAPSRETKRTASAEPSAKPQPSVRAKAEPRARAKAETVAKAQPEPVAKAKAEPKAKAKAAAKGKKDPPAKKDDDSEKGTAPDSKEGRQP